MNLSKLIILIFSVLFLLSCNTNKVDTSIPSFLKEYEDIYKQSPKKAALEWFEDARLGLFIHWGVWGKYHEAWAMYNT